MRKLALVMAAWMIFAAAPALAKSIDGNKAAEAALAKLKKLDGFTAIYLGESESSPTRPRLSVGYAKPDRLFVRVPEMNLHASHQAGEIRVLSGQQGISMSIAEIVDLTTAAQADFEKLSWLNVSRPEPEKMKARLDFEFGPGTLNIQINFDQGLDSFSWLSALRSEKALVSQTEEHFKAQFEAPDDGRYIYLISKKTGLLEKMIHEVQGRESRVISLVEFKKEIPEHALFANAFDETVEVGRFGASPDHKAQYLIGAYGGYQDVILKKTLPRWNQMPLAERKALAQSVATFWNEVFKNIFQSQKVVLEQTLADPKFAEMVNKKASDKAMFDQFKASLPQDKKTEARSQWVSQILGQVGYDLLDPFVAWTRSRFIEPAKTHLVENGPANGLDAAAQETFLGTIALPMIDACYAAAEPIVLPRLLPMIQQAAAGLE